MSSSLSCRICKALIDCPKDEADAFVKSLSEYLLSNSSAITALDICHPCLNEARNARPPSPVRGGLGVNYSQPITVTPV